MELGPRFRRVLRAEQVVAAYQHVARVEPRISCLVAVKAAEEKPRTGQDGDRQRDLSDHEHGGHADRAAGSHERACLLPERQDDVRARSPARGHGGDERCGNGREEYGKADDPRIDRDVEPRREVGGRDDPHEQVSRPPGDDQGADRRESGKERRVCQRLAREPRRRGAHRELHGRGTFPRLRPRELRLRDVDAREQQQ